MELVVLVDMVEELLVPVAVLVDVLVVVLAELEVSVAVLDDDTVLVDAELLEVDIVVVDVVVVVVDVKAPCTPTTSLFNALLAAIASANVAGNRVAMIEPRANWISIVWKPGAPDSCRLARIFASSSARSVVPKSNWWNTTLIGSKVVVVEVDVVVVMVSVVVVLVVDMLVELVVGLLVVVVEVSNPQTWHVHNPARNVTSLKWVPPGHITAASLFLPPWQSYVTSMRYNAAYKREASVAHASGLPSATGASRVVVGSDVTEVTSKVAPLKSTVPPQSPASQPSASWTALRETSSSA